MILHCSVCGYSVETSNNIRELRYGKLEPRRKRKCPHCGKELSDTIGNFKKIG